MKGEQAEKNFEEMLNKRLLLYAKKDFKMLFETTDFNEKEKLVAVLELINFNLLRAKEKEIAELVDNLGEKAESGELSIKNKPDIEKIYNLLEEKSGESTP